MPPWHSVPRRPLSLCLLAACLAAAWMAAARPALAIERRQPQFPQETAYLFVPFPYDLPGIGDGIAWTGLFANLLGTRADAYGIVVTGDAGGQILGLEDVHLLERRLILDLFSLNLDRATINSYETRGMESDGSDYRLLEASEVDIRSAELRLTFLERRLEVFAGWQEFRTAVVTVRQPDGTLVSTFSEPFRRRSESTWVGALLDYTDDNADPRRGLRLETVASRTPPDDADEADYVVWSHSLSGYIPLGRISTLVLHYFRSDANVRRQGNTDPAAIATELGLACAPGDTACEAARAQLIAEIVAARTNGTSETLGGQDRLRSYPMDRFQGAHTVFYAAELRWNLTEEVTPFDYFIWKDVRTNVQLAFFYETGSVGESRDEVGDIFKSSYGAGLRMVSGSGFVYRADVAWGDEGNETTIIFNYPF